MYIAMGYAFYMIEYIQEVFKLSLTIAGTLFGILTSTTSLVGTVLGSIILDLIMKKQESSTLLVRCQVATKVTGLFVVLGICLGLIMPFARKLPLFYVTLTSTISFLSMGTCTIKKCYSLECRVERSAVC